MATTSYQLDFEAPLRELQERIATIESGDAQSATARDDLRAARKATSGQDARSLQRAG